MATHCNHLARTHLKDCLPGYAVSSKASPYPERLNLLILSIDGPILGRQMGANSVCRFINLIVGDEILFVGEGNFSFSGTMSSFLQPFRCKIVATSFEAPQEWSPVTVKNVKNLRAKSIPVYGGVDGTKLDQQLPQQYFDTIVFQFPNTGSRDGIRGHTSNFVLVRRFLKSARLCLKDKGRVLVTSVDSPYYEGVFHFPEAAKNAGFEVSGPVTFNPADFPGYEHTNTNDDESAIEDYDRFGTWVFNPVK